MARKGRNTVFAGAVWRSVQWITATQGEHPLPEGVNGVYALACT